MTPRDDRGDPDIPHLPSDWRDGAWMLSRLFRDSSPGGAGLLLLAVIKLRCGLITNVAPNEFGIKVVRVVPQHARRAAEVYDTGFHLARRSISSACTVPRCR
jgi:hypothetical protein